jgi:hypothetical protein
MSQGFDLIRSAALSLHDNIPTIYYDYHDRWIVDDVLSEMIAKIIVSVNVTTSNMNRALCGKRFMKLTTDSEVNDLNMYRRRFSKNYYYFLSTDKNNPPPFIKGWSKLPSVIFELPSVDKTSSINSSNTTRKRKSPPINATPTPSVKVTDEGIFQSPESFLRFLGVKRTNENKDVDIKGIIHQQILLLRNAYLYHDQWRTVVDDEDEHNLMSVFDIYKLQKNCKYLSHVLIHCLHHYNNNIGEIAKQMIDKVNTFELYEGDETETRPKYQIRGSSVLMQKYNEFKLTNTFPNAYKERKKKSTEPPIPVENPVSK